MRPEVIAEFVSGFGSAVELCVGHYAEVARILQRMGKLLCVNDVKEIELPGIRFIRCDVRKPNKELLEVCKLADVVYSIRPPPELWYDIAKIAEKCGCHCVIRPMSCDAGWNLVGFERKYFRGEQFYVRSRTKV